MSVLEQIRSTLQENDDKKVIVSRSILWLTLIPFGLSLLFFYPKLMQGAIIEALTVPVVIAIAVGFFILKVVIPYLFEKRNANNGLLSKDEVTAYLQRGMLHVFEEHGLHLKDKPTPVVSEALRDIVAMIPDRNNEKITDYRTSGDSFFSADGDFIYTPFSIDIKITRRVKRSDGKGKRDDVTYETRDYVAMSQNLNVKEQASMAIRYKQNPSMLKTFANFLDDRGPYSFRSILENRGLEEHDISYFSERGFDLFTNDKIESQKMLRPSIVAAFVPALDSVANEQLHQHNQFKDVFGMLGSTSSSILNTATSDSFSSIEKAKQESFVLVADGYAHTVVRCPESLKDKNFDNLVYSTYFFKDSVSGFDKMISELDASIRSSHPALNALADK